MRHRFSHAVGLRTRHTKAFWSYSAMQALTAVPPIMTDWTCLVFLQTIEFWISHPTEAERMLQSRPWIFNLSTGQKQVSTATIFMFALQCAAPASFCWQCILSRHTNAVCLFVSLSLLIVRLALSISCCRVSVISSEFRQSRWPF